MSRRYLPCALLLALLLPSAAAPPSWWASRGATNGAPLSDSSPVTQGQLKQFTFKAVEELNSRLPGGAGTELTTLIGQWVTNHPDSDDTSVMTLGQVKWIAKLTYQRLLHIKYVDTMPTWLPAAPSPSSAESDKQIANIGQLKAIFNFDLSAPAGTLPAWWQKYYFGGLGIATPTGVLQPDGLTNVEKVELGLDPTVDYTATGAAAPSKYDYDPTGRLTGVTAPVGSGTYTPDEEGNLLNAH